MRRWLAVAAVSGSRIHRSSALPSWKDHTHKKSINQWVVTFTYGAIFGSGLAERSRAPNSNSGVLISKVWVWAPVVTLVSLRTLNHCFVLWMGRKTVGPVCCVTHVKEPSALIKMKRGSHQKKWKSCASWESFQPEVWVPIAWLRGRSRWLPAGRSWDVAVDSSQSTRPPSGLLRCWSSSAPKQRTSRRPTLLLWTDHCWEDKEKSKLTTNIEGV